MNEELPVISGSLSLNVDIESIVFGGGQSATDDTLVIQPVAVQLNKVQRSVLSHKAAMLGMTVRDLALKLVLEGLEKL